MIRNIRRTTIHKIWRDNLQDPIHNNLQDPIHDMIQKRYSTQSDCRFAISPEGAVSSALPGAGQPRDGNSLRSSDLAPLTPNYLRAQNVIRKRPYPGLTELWSGWNGRLHCVRWSGSPGTLDVRTVTAVDARPGPSSFAPIFGTSPQYCMLGAPSILRSLVASRDVQTFARPVDLVEEIDFLQRQDPPGWPGRDGILLEILLRPGDLPSVRPRGGVLLCTPPFWGPHSFQFQTVRASLSIADGVTLTRGLRRHFLRHATLSFSRCSPSQQYSGFPRNTK